MTTQVRTAFQVPPASGRWAWLRNSAARLAAGAFRLRAPAASHLRDHAYTIAGFTSITSAAFIHSVFSGLIVLGLLLLVFEWKVGD